MKILFNDRNNPYPFDYSVKFVNLLLPEYVIEYLDKDLVYEASLPTVIVKPNQTESRNDYTYLVHLKEIFDKKLIIDFEHQSYSVDENRLVSMLWDLISFIFIYQINAILIIFTDEESYKKSVKSISLDGCINCTPFYFYFRFEEIEKKLSIIDEKINNNDDLTNQEYLDLVFLSIISPEKKRAEITRTCVNLYSRIDVEDKKIDLVIKYCLTSMVNIYLPEVEHESFFEVIGILTFEQAQEIVINQVIAERESKLDEDNANLNQRIDCLEGLLIELHKEGIISDEKLKEIGLSDTD